MSFLSKIRSGSLGSTMSFAAKARYPETASAHRRMLSSLSLQRFTPPSSYPNSSLSGRRCSSLTVSTGKGTETNYSSTFVLLTTISLVAIAQKKESNAKQLARSMEEIETSFSKFDHFKPEERTQFVEKLKDAYLLLRQNCIAQKKQGIPPDLQQHAARLFHMYGRVLYPNMHPAKALFQFSVCFQLRALQSSAFPEVDSLWIGCESLEALPAFLISNQKTYLLQIDVRDKECIERIVSSGQKQALAVAHTLRYLGHCYQNLPEFGKPTEENIGLFENIYGLSGLILDHFEDEDSRWEWVELKYNTERFLLSLKHPHDVSKGLASLDAVKKELEKFPQDSLRVVEKRAQLHNILAIETMKLYTTCKDSTAKKEFFKQVYANTYAANQLAASREDFNPFLKSMFSYNVALRACSYEKEFGEKIASSTQIDAWFAYFKKTAEAYHYEHYYYAHMFLNIARLEKASGKLAEASKSLQIAEEVASRFPHETVETAKEIGKERVTLGNPSEKYCAFCDQEVLNRQTFYEDHLVRALYTHKPVLPGHCLVIPMRHVERFEELTDAEIVQMSRVIRKVNRAAILVFKTSSYLLLQKNGPEAGQTVFHAHFHYMPRETGDKSVLKFLAKMLIAPLWKPLPETEMQRVVAEMKAAMEESEGS